MIIIIIRAPRHGVRMCENRWVSKIADWFFRPRTKGVMPQSCGGFTLLASNLLFGVGVPKALGLWVGIHPHDDGVDEDEDDDDHGRDHDDIISQACLLGLRPVLSVRLSCQGCLPGLPTRTACQACLPGPATSLACQACLPGLRPSSPARPACHRWREPCKNRWQEPVARTLREPLRDRWWGPLPEPLREPCENRCKTSGENRCENRWENCCENRS